MTPCRPSCPAGDCANCVRFDRQPAAERPRCMPRQDDLHAAMDDTSDWAQTCQNRSAAAAESHDDL